MNDSQEHTSRNGAIGAEEVHRLCLGAIAKITGHRLQDLSGEMHLEADLGLDSIKMVELLSSLMQEVPVARRGDVERDDLLRDVLRLQTIDELLRAIAGLAAEAGSGGGRTEPAHGPAPAEVASPAPEAVVAGGVTSSALRSTVVAAIARVSGHRASDLADDLALESDVGLDSIKMVQLLNDLAREMPSSSTGVLREDDLQRLLAAQTVRELVDALSALVAIAPSAALPDPAHLTVADAQLPFLVASVAGVSLCALCSRVRVRGPLDEDLGSAAWADLIQRHPVLRARFAPPASEGTLADWRLECVGTIEAPRLRITSLVHLDRRAQERVLAQRFEAALNRAWDLSSWPLHEIAAYALSGGEFELHFQNHHLVSDGLGNQMMVREFLGACATRAKGETPAAPGLAASAYNERVAALDAWPDRGEDAALQVYLAAQGAGRTLWNAKGRRSTAGTVRTATRLHRLDERVTAALMARVGAMRVPLNALVVAAYLRALGDAGGLPGKFTLQIPTGGRVHPAADLSDVLGCFAQNLALTFEAPRAGESWLDLCRRVDAEIARAVGAGIDRAQVRRAALAAKKQRLVHGAQPSALATLVRASSKSNLYLPFIGHTRIERRYGPLEVLAYQASTATSPATIDDVVEIFDGALQLSSNYDSEFFTESEIDGLMRAFVHRLEEVAVAGDRAAACEPVGKASAEDLRQVAAAVGELCRRELSPSELGADLEAELGLDSLDRIRVVHRLHRDRPGADRQRLMTCRTVAELAGALGEGPGTQGAAEDDVLARPRAMPYLRFVEQARLTPDAVAVLDAWSSLSYRELDARSNQVARSLARQGVAPGTPVGLLVRPSAELLVGLLGILKAGCAYVPLDPEYPAARLEYVAEHARLGAVVADAALAGELLPRIDPRGGVRRVLLVSGEANALRDRDVVAVGTWREEVADAVPVLVDADALMTVLYTSGSTGKPKGVALSHRGYMNRLVWMQKTFALQPGERVAQKTSPCFDISVWELLWPLMYGATVCPVERRIVRDPWQLASWMRTTGIHVMHFVPSLFAEFVASLETGASFPDLRWLVFSGEALTASAVRGWMDRCGERVRLANLYGPTEASIDVSCYIIEHRPDADERIPIGRPVDNTELLVLDPALRPCENGEVGELWIGGVQLALGYLHEPELTAERFQQVPGARSRVLYRTGDLASRTSDGVFHYHGRLDAQVKVRGFRVELGEIEAALDAVPGVRENAVLSVDEGVGKLRLAAYVVVARAGLDARAIRDELRRTLPDYMIPHRIELLPALPKNANGKLDRGALRERTGVGGGAPAPDAHRSASDATRAAGELALPLGPAQRWILRYFDAPYAWYGSTRFRHDGPLDVALLEQALNRVVDRHGALRTTFRRGAEGWRQVVHPPGRRLAITVYDCADMDETEREAEVRRLTVAACAEMSIESGPLLAVLLFALGGGRYEVVVVGHHLDADLVSSQIVFDEVWAAYEALRRDPECSPGDASTPSYAEYVKILEGARADGTLERHASWWREHLGGAAPLAVPRDHDRGPNDEASERIESLELPEAASRRLREDARREHGASVYHLLLAPLYAALSEWTGQRSVALSHRSHGRDLGQGMAFPRSVGNFAVNFPIALDVGPGQSWAERVHRVRDAFAALPMNGVTYDLVGEELSPQLYPDAELAPVRVNYLGDRTPRRREGFEFVEGERDRRLAMPEQRRTCLVEIFLSFVNGRLRVDASYSANHHRPETIRRLLDRFRGQLEAMLADVGAARRGGRAVATQAEHVAAPAGAHGLAGKVAIVTGGGRGIGRAAALELARRGARVVVAARTRGQVDDSVGEITSRGGEALGVVADVARMDDVERMVASTVARFGGLDVLVNNAGITHLVPLAESDPAEWRRIMEVNLFGAYHCCRAALGHLRRRGGKIVNVGSDSSLIGYPLLSAYAASKHAVVGLTRALAEEVKLEGIQVNAVCPALVDTDMAPPAFRAEALPPAKVAHVIAFLASPESDGITGETISVFGGQDMYWYGSRKMALVRAAVAGAKGGRLGVDA